MRLRWTRTALRDLDSLERYIAQDNPSAADAMVDRILRTIQLLTKNPEMGRRGRVPRTRELVIPPYLIAYRVRRTEISIVAIIHGARRWPDTF